MADKKIVGFKKFSEIKSKPKIEEADLSIEPQKDSDIPMNPNLSDKSKKIEKPISRKGLQPEPQDINLPSDENKKVEEIVETIGRVARFTKGTKASKAYNFLESGENSTP